MKCERSFKQILLTHWGLTELHNGKSYDEVQKEMRRLRRLTIAQIKQIRVGQKVGK
jgi:hypothetical protein